MHFIYVTLLKYPSGHEVKHELFEERRKPSMHAVHFFYDYIHSEQGN